MTDERLSMAVGQSAGIPLLRRGAVPAREREVLLGHPRGLLVARGDEGRWSIPIAAMRIWLSVRVQRAADGVGLCPDRVVGDLGVKSQANQDAKGTLTFPVVGQWLGATAPELRSGGGELRHVVAGCECVIDQLAVDSGGLEARPDAFGAPAVDVAAVFGEQAGVALVVDVALLGDDRERLRDDLSGEPGAFESSSQFGDAVLAIPEVAVAAAERVVQLAGVTLGGVLRAHRVRRRARRQS